MRLTKDKGYILYLVTYNISYLILNHKLFNINILVLGLSLNVKVILNLMIGILNFLFIAYSSYQTLIEYQKSRIRSYKENQKNRFLNKIIIKDENILMNNLIIYSIFFFLVSIIDLCLNSRVIEYQGGNMEEEENIYSLLYLFLILFIFNNINNCDTLLKISYINTDNGNSNNSENNDNNNNDTLSFQYKKLSIGKFTILSANMSYFKLIIRKKDNDYNFDFNKDYKNSSYNSLDREFSVINNIIIVNPTIYDNTKSNSLSIFGKYSFFMANQLISK